MKLSTLLLVFATMAGCTAQVDSYFEDVPDEPALASSHAHALARTGQKARAEQVLVRNARLSPGLAHATVEAWTGARRH